MRNIPVKSYHIQKPKKRKLPRYYGQKNKNSIDAGWRYFWAKRGYTIPPNVSSYQVGAFILPNKADESRA